MNLSAKPHLNELIENNNQPCVSLYLPTHRIGDIEQDPIRLKNMLREAIDRLSEYGLNSNEITNMLAPIDKLLTDSLFWQHQSNGLSIFVSPNYFTYFRMPYTFHELVVVADRFHIKPLITWFAENETFYILAVSQNQVRLLQCTKYSSQDITPDNLPAGIKDALKYDDPEKQLQYHTTGVDGSAIYHGHGVTKDYDKDAILRYFRIINQSLQSVLKKEHNPLILAAVDYLHPIYKEVNTYKGLLDGGISGNPEEESDETLREHGWNIIEPYHKQQLRETINEFNESTGKGLATNDLEQAVLAAYDKRVSKLLVALNNPQWGHFDVKNRRVFLWSEQKTTAEDLLDIAAVFTLNNSGKVYTLEKEKMPANTIIAAILRY